MTETVHCPDHRPRQHRDGKPPWCRNCGLTEDGQVPAVRWPAPSDPPRPTTFPSPHHVTEVRPQQPEDRTRTEWGVRHFDGHVQSNGSSEGAEVSARYDVEFVHQGRVVKRVFTTTPWTSA